MTQRYVDCDVVRRRRAELGLSLREVAAAIGVTGQAYTAIENGTAQAELSWATVVRLSEALGLGLDQVLARGGDAREEPDDAVRVGKMLHGASSPVPLGAICEATGWTLERSRQAVGELERRLPAVGLRLRKVASGVSVVPDGTSDSAVAEVLRTHFARRHVSVTEANMIRAIRHGDVPTQPANHERVAMGVLVNAGLVEIEEPTGRSRERAMVLSATARFSLLLDEEPDPDEVVPVRRPRRSSVIVSTRPDQP